MFEKKNGLPHDIYHLVLYTVVNFVSLLLHVVVLPDHLPSASHDRTRDPTSRCPWLQEKEAWEPNEDPHEREAMEPKTGGWRSRQDFPVDAKSFTTVNI